MSGDVLPISGKALSVERFIGKVLGAIAAALIGWLFWSKGDSSEEGVGFLIIGGIFFTIALACPLNIHEFLDLSAGHSIKTVHYLGIRVFRSHRSLDNYDRIILRHVCHNDSEGPEIFTGSVGLKNDSRTEILWVKHFPTNEEMVPAEALAFARELAAKTSLPLSNIPLQAGVETTSAPQPQAQG